MKKIILANYSESTIRVYQAYNSLIADEAVQKQTFGKYFKRERMTWIKPSFLWMMYRCGWAYKENQERVLAIDIKREGFEQILSQAILSKHIEKMYGSYENWKKLLSESNVRCQWDPDRDIYANPIDRRAIQLGIRGKVVDKYIDEWIVKITDMTQIAHQYKALIDENKFDLALLAKEKEYPISETLQKALGMFL